MTLLLSFTQDSRNNDDKAKTKQSDSENNRSMKYSPTKSVTTTPLGNSTSHTIVLPPASSSNTQVNNSPTEESLTGKSTTLQQKNPSQFVCFYSSPCSIVNHILDHPSVGDILLFSCDVYRSTYFECWTGFGNPLHV